MSTTQTLTESNCSYVNMLPWHAECS